MRTNYSCIPFKRLLAVVLGLALVAPSVPAMVQNKQWYAVEVVVFRHWVAPGDDREYWPDLPQPITQLATKHLVTLGPVASGPDAPAFSRLAHSQIRLAGVRKRLERSNDYVVLLHAAWRQPALKPANAHAVVLPLHWQPPALQTTPANTTASSQSSLDKRPNSKRDSPRELANISAHSGKSLNQPFVGSKDLPTESTDTAHKQNLFDYLPPDTHLWGILRLSRQPYLTFHVNLRFQREGIGRARVEDGPVAYPMIQSRRIEAGKIHYLDHPVLGVLVQVRELQHNRERN